MACCAGAWLEAAAEKACFREKPQGSSLTGFSAGFACISYPPWDIASLSPMGYSIPHGIFSYPPSNLYSFCPHLH